MPRAASPALVAMLALVVAGCASVSHAPPAEMAAPVDEPFAIDGRFSARRGNDAVAVSFSWSHAPPSDELVVTTPLGSAVAELSGDASLHRVGVRTADGRTDAAGDWATLTERIIGFPVPVEGLAYWAQGMPRPEAAHAAEWDAAGRMSVLRQDGCEIVYAFADDAARRPARLRLVCHDLELRIVVDRWRSTKVLP
jgi:outer membrane lipoprotein LolB